MADSHAVTKGTLDVIVLRALSWGSMHGFEIVEWIEQSTGQTIGITDAAVYQALYRMERRGLLTGSWGVTDNNRRARYYALTRTGTAHLREETKRWTQYAAVVTTLLTAPAGARPRK
ncbi:MAG TPA: PadR family transcriptional regulator [Gemmatimonadaceae bacterium]|jgi:transcriptional regulator|nr:PadR family transcriptional regulator [Gemmatimonadaceae bacterium]